MHIDSSFTPQRQACSFQSHYIAITTFQLVYLPPFRSHHHARLTEVREALTCDLSSHTATDLSHDSSWPQFWIQWTVTWKQNQHIETALRHSHDWEHNNHCTVGRREAALCAVTWRTLLSRCQCTHCRMGTRTGDDPGVSWCPHILGFNQGVTCSGRTPQYRRLWTWLSPIPYVMQATLNFKRSGEHINMPIIAFAQTLVSKIFCASAQPPWGGAKNFPIDFRRRLYLLLWGTHFGKQIDRRSWQWARYQV